MNKLLMAMLVLLNGCAVVAEYPVTATSLAVMGATGKGPADHVLSHVAERDCASLRLLDGKKICQDYVSAPITDITAKAKATQIQLVTSDVDTVSLANDVFAKRAKR
jgi:hypothetical protein